MLQLFKHPASAGFFMLSSLLVQNSQASTLAVEGGEKNIQIVYTVPIIYAVSAPLIADTALLYSRQNNHQDLLATAGITAYSGNNFALGAGLKLVASDPLDYYLTAITLGLNLRYQTPSPAIRFETSFYYAGDSLTYSDGKKLSLLILNMDYEISDDLFIRFGYRKIKTSLNNGVSADFNDGLYLGLSWLY